MLLTYGILAFSTSIDAIGIGLSYGVRGIKISKVAASILFVISFLVSTIALGVGKFFESLFSTNITNYIGSFILIVMGVLLILQSMKNPESYDLDNSKHIDSKEAVSLGTALSLDSFSIGIGAGILAQGAFWVFPILVASFQMIFLLIGRFLGIKLNKLSKIPSILWNCIAGILLILIGGVRLL